MKNHTSPTESRSRLHNVRFYNLTPRSIQCFAYNKIWHKLAVARSDGSIEIWDVQHAAKLVKTIPKSPGNSIEGIAWSGERLFSVGLSGELIEWDLQQMKPRRQQHATGNAIWCLDVNSAGDELALGTEEGYINVFSVADDELMYKQLFDKQEGRVLCCKFDATGEYLVTGSLGTIRIWNVATGHAIHRMTFARVARQKDVIVWSLQVLRDFTIIAGDSRGIVSVWDGRNAVEVESHQVLKADVLAVTVNEAENLLICSGIEPIIRMYTKTQIKMEDTSFHRWVKSLQRSVHEHDVKALTCAGDRIFSGGVDGYLGISSMSRAKSAMVRHGPFLQNPCSSVSPEQNLLLLRYPTYLEVWRFGTAAEQCSADNDTAATFKGSEKGDRKILPLSVPPEKLLEFKSKNEEPIVCAALSPDGQWLCYSTAIETRLFRYLPAVADKHASQLMRLKDLPDQFTTACASHLDFTGDSKQLFIANAATKQIQVFTILADGSTDIDFHSTIEMGKHIKDALTHFTVSRCGSYVVAASADRTIAVWVIQNRYYKHFFNLPRYTATTAALALHAGEPRLVVAFTDAKVFEYDLEEMRFTCTARLDFVEQTEAHSIRSIVLDPQNPDVFFMVNDCNFFALEKFTPDTEAEVLENGPLKKKRAAKHRDPISDTSSTEESPVCSLRLRLQRPVEHMIELCRLNDEALVAIGVNPISLIDQLPDAFKQKKFGVS